MSAAEAVGGAIGDRFIIFTYVGTVDDDGRTIVMSEVDRGVVHDSREGLRVPASLRELDDDFDALRAAVAAALNR